MFKKLLVRLLIGLIPWNDRIISRDRKKAGTAVNEDLYIHNILSVRDKMKVLKSSFEQIKKSVVKNGTGKFTPEQIYQFSLIKREYNSLINK